MMTTRSLGIKKTNCSSEAIIYKQTEIKVTITLQQTASSSPSSSSRDEAVNHMTSTWHRRQTRSDYHQFTITNQHAISLNNTPPYCNWKGNGSESATDVERKGIVLFVEYITFAQVKFRSLEDAITL